MAGALAGRASLIVDANQAWSETTALRCLPTLAELGVRLVEQPLPAWNLAGMAGLRARSTVPRRGCGPNYSPKGLPSARDGST